MKKFKFNSVLLIVNVVILSLISCEKEKDKITKNDIIPSDTTHLDSGIIKDSYKKFCDDYAIFYVNTEYMVRNNVCGNDAGSFTTTYSHCIFYDSLFPATFGWEWDIERQTESPSYPNIEYGWNPWEPSPTTHKLPIRLNTLSSCIVSFDKEFSAEGYHNTAFDIWLLNAETSKPEFVSAEIMIWLESNITCGADLIHANLSINDQTYDLYKTTEWSSIPYIAFVKKDHFWDGQLDILSFITYLIENGHISSDDYLALIEFGNEIWSGSGKMEIKDYLITIE